MNHSGWAALFPSHALGKDFSYFSVFARLCKLAKRFNLFGDVCDIRPTAPVTEYHQYIRTFW